ncbi:MAG: HD domain-containing protein [Treponema sp.]|jgi:HD-GYP domain-containing protein (c-di-GMP phosphodiesterase class II)|nr:HD domain-containing protein [Treponema sp.]
MKIRLDLLIESIATALDIVEGELLGASTHHGKRIAVLCSAMGRNAGLNDEDLSALTTCALLHDNALTEYILSEREGNKQDHNLKRHCELGQRNVDTLLFKTDISGFVLYHHERPDGLGPYGKKTGEIPLGAELIAIADSVDVSYHLQRVTAEDLPRIRRSIADKAGAAYTPFAAEALLSALDETMLVSLGNDRILDTADKLIPPWTMDMDNQVTLNLGELVSQIIDYKSPFTRRHSRGIAEKARNMGKHYGYDQSQLAELFLAASLHDIGKLAIPTAILEKPGKLDDDEFNIIKGHVSLTYKLLAGVQGLEHIRDWASNHHEKLDGSGYPFGKKAAELDFNSRLMACIDIYQAVSEERPYHPARDHGAAMAILFDMADKGLIDPGIARDMDRALAPPAAEVSPETPEP